MEALPGSAKALEFNLSGILPLRPKPKLRPKREPKLRPNQGSFLFGLSLGNLPKLRQHCLSLGIQPKHYLWLSLVSIMVSLFQPHKYESYT